MEAMTLEREWLASYLDDGGWHDEAANVRNGIDLESYETDLRLIDWLRRHTHLARPAQAVDVERVLIALGHVRVPNTQCLARVAETPPELRPPGPQNPPMWCCLTEGHDGQHRHNGGGMYRSIPFRDTDTVVMGPPLPDYCQKCNRVWPCDDAKALTRALSGEKAGPVGDGWISVDDRLPEPCQFVLASYLNTNGKGRVIRAMYAAPRTLELHMDAEGGEYDEETDTYWCEPGWYEANDNEEIHWFVAEKVTHWMPLPASPTPDKEGA